MVQFSAQVENDFAITDEVRLRLKQGEIIGKMCKDKRGVSFFSFQSIPYAKPPVRDLRFKAPELPEDWGDILDATQEPPKCYQKHHIRIEEVGDDEDCLYLNVYTPEIEPNAPLFPVMVYIHGGAFLAGSSKSTNYGAEFLMIADIVLVTFNYRVGVLGFLSMEDESLGVPGNAGLKDQVMALQWVQANIKKFRGNPKNVTIFGNSAGAISVHLHILSPMSKGLFHKAIMQSGSALCPWANGIKGNGKLLAKALEFHNLDDETEILGYLKALSLEKLLAAQDIILNPLQIDINWVCAPVIETQQTEPAFLTDEPVNIILSGNYNHVPIMIGYTNLEGLYYDVYNILYSGRSILINDFATVIPNNIRCRKGSELSKTMAKKIKAYYYGTKDEPHLRDKMPLFNLITDTFFLRGIDRAVRNHVENTKCDIYYYRFSLDTALNKAKFAVTGRANYKKYQGAAHGDELGYLFKCSKTPEIELDSIEDMSVNRIIALWTNFAKYGDPTPATGYYVRIRWKPVLKNVIWFMDIGEELELGLNPDRQRMRFWDILYQNDKRTRFL